MGVEPLIHCMQKASESTLWDTEEIEGMVMVMVMVTIMMIMTPSFEFVTILMCCRLMLVLNRYTVWKESYRTCESMH